MGSKHKGEEVSSSLKGTLSFFREVFLNLFSLARSPREGIKGLYRISLYRNAVYLMTNAGITTALGFIFWVVVARLYPANDVGLSSALISAATFLSFIATLGFGFGLIRFLPSSDNKVSLLNSSFLISLLAAVTVALIFLIGLPLWSPKLMFVRENLAFAAIFFFSVAIGTFSVILGAVFIGFRKASFTLAQGTITNAVKLILVVTFAAGSKVFGIFASWAIAVAVASAFSLFLFLPKVLPGYNPIPSSQYRASGELVRFSFANYISELLRSLPLWILPLAVVNILGAEANAYFFVSWAMAELLMAITGGISTSLLAEGSSAEKRLGDDIRRSLKLLALLLIPAVVIMVLLGDKLLLLFGREYSREGARLLWLLAPAMIPASINYLYLGVARVEKKLKNLIVTTGAIAFGTLLLSYLLLPYLGILGVGAAWLATQAVMAIALLPKLLIRSRFRVQKVVNLSQGVKDV